MYKFTSHLSINIFYIVYFYKTFGHIPHPNMLFIKYTPMASEVKTKWSWAALGCWSRVKWAGKLLELRELTRYSNVLAAASHGAPLHWDCSGNLPVISLISDSISTAAQSWMYFHVYDHDDDWSFPHRNNLYKWMMEILWKWAFEAENYEYA